MQEPQRNLKKGKHRILPKAHIITIWVSLSITVMLSVIDLIRRIFPIDGNYEPMKLSTAICFLLSVIVLILFYKPRNLFLRITGGIFWMLVILIAIFTFVNQVIQLTPADIPKTGMRIYELLFSESNRMALLTTTSFFILGTILLLIYLNRRVYAHILTIPLSLLTYFFLLTYILNIDIPGGYIIPLSLDTSIAMAGLSVAIFMFFPQTKLMKVFTSGNTGGIIARQLLVPAIIIPVLIGWMRITGERQGLFSSAIGVVLVALVYTLCFGILIWLAASSLNKVDLRRQKSEEVTARSLTRLELLSETASRLLVSDNPQKIVNEICNQIKDYLNCEVFFNYLVDEESRSLHLNAFAGIPEKEADDIKDLEFGTAVCGCVARDGERIVSECIQETDDPRADLVRSYGIQAYACHPLMSHDKVIGTLSFGAKNRDKFSTEDLSLMKIVTDQVAIAMGRIKNEKALRDSEDRFRTIAESLAVAIGITRIRDSRVIFTNDAYDKTFGYKKGALTGKKAADIYFNPDERNQLLEILKEKGFVNNYETRVLRSDGTPFWIVASIRKVIFEGEPAFISALMDIDQMKNVQKELLQLNRTLNALGKSSQAMMHTLDEVQYLNNVCRIIVEDCGYLMVWVGYANNDEAKTVTPVAHHGFDNEYIDKMQISWADNERGRGPTGTAIRTGKPAVCKNMLTDPDFLPWREDALQRGYASSIVLPLVADDKVFGVINVYSKDADAFFEDDLKMLLNLAEEVAYGITYIRLAVSEKNAARIIKESEEKYRLLFDEMTEGFALHELILNEDEQPVDYKFISVNPAFERQTGLKAEEVVGKTAREVLPGFENHWLNSYSEVALTGKSKEFENFSSDLNSYYRVSAFSPKKGFFAVIFENITQRVIAEKELKNTKNYLENLVNYANAPIIVWNTNTEIQLFNHAFERLTGYTADDVIGKKLDLLFPESTLADSNLKIKDALINNLETIEIPILTKSKLVKTVLWNSANILDPDSKQIISTIAQGQDITERIQAENEVRAAKEKLDLALENANIGIWTWDITDNRLELDDRIYRMFGKEQGDENKGFEEFDKYIFEEDIPHFNRAINKVFKDDKPLDTIFRIRLNSGEFNYIDAKARLEKDAQGKPIKMTGVCLDITAMQKATERTLLNLNEDLLRSNKELEQFAYVASHDLQEPLRMVSSFTQLLAARYQDKLDKQAMEFIDFAVDGAQRMQRLINDLLQYSRVKTRGKSLSVIDMNNVLNQTLHNLSIKISEKKAVITNDPLPSVYADDSQMVQLFQNLIENGIKFCNKKPKIHVSSKEEADYFHFAIKDNGIGIQPQYYDRIFQIFQRLHLRDEYGGTGIGLAICKRIVERHGGTIWVESNGKGTEFNFTIKKV